MAIRNDRDIDTRREERGGWQQMQGDFGRMQSREDVRGYQPRDWRHEDRFGSEDDERRYGMMGRDDRRDEDEDRGWFDRMRDTASRWFRGREDEDEDREYGRRDEEWRSRDRDEDEDRGWRSRSRFDSRFDRDEDRMRMGRREMGRGYPDRDWQQDDRRMRGDEDYRRRQFAGFDRDEDDRSRQFNRMREERHTMGRRGEQGLTGRSRFDRHDERGRFSRFADEDERDRERYGRGYGGGYTSGRGGGYGGMGGYGNYERESQGQRYGMDRDEYGRYMPGRQERVEHDEDMRRGRWRMSERDRRR